MSLSLPNETGITELLLLSLVDKIVIAFIVHLFSLPDGMDRAFIVLLFSLLDGIDVDYVFLFTFLANFLIVYLFFP